MGWVKKAGIAALAVALFGGMLYAAVPLERVQTPVTPVQSTDGAKLTVIVEFPPKDLTLSVNFADPGAGSEVPLLKTQLWGEANFRLFFADYSTIQEANRGVSFLIASSAEKSFVVKLPQFDFFAEDNVVTLNFTDQTLMMGQAPGRAPALFAIHVGLALLLEGLIFLAFGYRKLKSWLVFLVTNLITQALINFVLIFKIGVDGSYAGLFGSAVILTLLLAAVVFIVAEALIYIKMLTEQADSRAVTYAVAANLASMALGMALQSYLPL